jgi:hypothetical protein
MPQLSRNGPVRIECKSAYRKGAGFLSACSQPVRRSVASTYYCSAVRSARYGLPKITGAESDITTSNVYVGTMLQRGWCCTSAVSSMISDSFLPSDRTYTDALWTESLLRWTVSTEVQEDFNDDHAQSTLSICPRCSGTEPLSLTHLTPFRAAAAQSDQENDSMTETEIPTFNVTSQTWACSLTCCHGNLELKIHFRKTFNKCELRLSAVNLIWLIYCEINFLDSEHSFKERLAFLLHYPVYSL